MSDSENTTGAVIGPDNITQTGIRQMETWAKELAIHTPAEYQAAIDGLKQVKTLRQGITRFFEDSKTKAHAAWKAICGNEKQFTDRLDVVEAKAKNILTAYARVEEEKRQAEQRRLQAEADEAARRERERLEKEAAKLKTPEKREERLAQAAAVVAPVVNIAPTTPAVKGTAMRKVWRARVVDAQAVPRAWLMVNDKALNAFAVSTKGAVPVKGVEFYVEDRMAVSTR